MTLDDLTSFDCIIGIILAVFLLRGLCVGFFRQAAAAAALAGSYWLAGEYVGEAMPYVQDIVKRPGAAFLIGFSVLFAAFSLLLTMIGLLLRRMLEIKLLGWSNRLGGGLLGLIIGGLATALLHMILASALSPSHHLFQNSLVAPHLSKGAEFIRQLIRDAAAREDLRPKEPPPAPKEERSGGKEAPAAEKVLPVTIPDDDALPPDLELEEETESGPAQAAPAEN